MSKFTGFVILVVENDSRRRAITRRAILAAGIHRSKILEAASACDVGKLVLGIEPDHLERPTACIAGLTPREREVLKLVAEGKNSREIGAALFVATKTVVWHRQSIMRKLELRTVAELTKYAVRAGLTPL